MLLLLCLLFLYVSSGIQSSASALDVGQISLELFDLDKNRATTSDITFNLQAKTSSRSTVDRAPKPFFTKVNEEVFRKPTYSALIKLLDNYVAEVGSKEFVTKEKLTEQTQFVNRFLETPIGKKLFGFLSDKGAPGCGNLKSFKATLQTIWFGLYSRGAQTNYQAGSKFYHRQQPSSKGKHGKRAKKKRKGKRHQKQKHHGGARNRHAGNGHSLVKDSSGFEHVFVGETRDQTVIGFHNWIRFYEEENKKNLNYLGYIDKATPNLYKLHFNWTHSMKPASSIPIGTSPEYEFAVYTLCHMITLIRPDDEVRDSCQVTLRFNGTPKVHNIKTVAWSHSKPGNGLKYINTAFFVI